MMVDLFIDVVAVLLLIGLVATFLSICHSIEHSGM